MKTTHVLCVVSLFAFLGCDQGEATETQAAPTVAVEGAEAAAEAVAGSGQLAQGAENLPTGMEQLGEALAAAASAQNAEGDTHCEQAFNGITRMMDALQKVGPPGGGPLPRRPDREGFLAACGQLPEPLQQCMIISYSTQHREECRARADGLDDEMKLKFTRLMGRP